MLIKKDEFWYMADVVCNLLEIDNISEAIDDFCHDELIKLNLCRGGKVDFINEFRLYKMLFK
ncbi:MAG: BRO family protein [Bacillota bacterium]